MKHKHALFALSLLGLLLVVAGGMAQTKSDKGAPPASAPATAPMAHEPGRCPMHALRDLAEIKSEKSASGATLSFRAKDPAKLLEVQTLVEKLAGCVRGDGMKAGKCAECEAHGPMMRHGAAMK